LTPEKIKKKLNQNPRKNNEGCKAVDEIRISETVRYEDQTIESKNTMTQYNTNTESNVESEKCD
jgi:hypothetical protein